jgi:hypothetical protein
MRLKDRNKFPPGGFRFTSAATNWSIRPWSSFDQAVAQIIQHRQGNPHKVAELNWSLDPFVVAEELEQFNVAVCQQMGWREYITDGGPDPGLPKVPSPQSGLSRSAQLAVGISTIREWEIAGGNVVDRDKANARAKICSSCIKNESGDLLDFFTSKASELIRLQLESKNNMKLNTDLDPLLGICSACHCPMKLKVWCPLDIIKSKLPKESSDALASECWIRHEQ